MSMVLNTNVLANNAHRALKVLGTKQAKASARLSSGRRINNAADDAAGLAISEKMKAQIRGLQQAERNVQDGISLIQTAEGGMNQISDMVIRQRELVVQALSDTNSDEDKAMIQLEIDQLTEEIDAMAGKTEYNETPLLNVPPEGYWEAGSSVSLTLPAATPFPNPNTPTPGYGYIDIPAGATLTVQVQVPPESLSGNWPDLIIYAPNGDKFGYAQNGFFHNGESGTVTSTTAADSVTYSGINSIMNPPHIESYTITNVSAAGAGKWMVGMSNAGGYVPISFSLSIVNETTPLTIVPHSTPDVFVHGELYIQVGANRGEGTYINRYDCRASSLGIRPIIVDPFEAAIESLGKLDTSLNTLNGYRATCGAQQNRLEYTANSIAVSHMNLEDANSRIADADMAKEMMELTKSNVLQQAAVAVLTQANQRPQSVLQLLRD